MWYNYFAYFGIRFFRYVCITYWNNVTATFYFRTSFWRNFFTPRLRYLFVQWSYFCLTTLQVPYIFVRLNCVNCVRKLSYKLLFFSYIIFAYQFFINLISKKFDYSFDEADAHFYMELFYLFRFPSKNKNKLQQTIQKTKITNKMPSRVTKFAKRRIAYYVTIALLFLSLQYHFLIVLRLLFIGIFTLNTDITLQSRFIFFQHCGEFFICHNYIITCFDTNKF